MASNDTGTHYITCHRSITFGVQGLIDTKQLFLTYSTQLVTAEKEFKPLDTMMTSSKKRRAIERASDKLTFPCKKIVSSFLNSVTTAAAVAARRGTAHRVSISFHIFD